MEKRFVLIICNMNPYIYSSGTEKYIISQVEAFRKRGIEVYCFFPINKTYGCFDLKIWGYVYDNKFQRMYCTEDVESFISNKLEEGTCAGVYVHGLMYADLQLLYRLINFRNNIVFYLHDFYTCCEQFNLLKNGKDYCGDALLYDDKCLGCSFYEKSKARKEELNSFFSRINDIHFIAPSEFVKNLWCQAYPEYESRVEVIGHKKLAGTYNGNCETIDEKSKIKVAFVGRAHPNKGYLLWEEAAKRQYDNIELYFFGEAEKKYSHVKYVDVSINNGEENGMVAALRKHGIHVALLLSICPETYSYTFCETLVSNCFIIANKESGNIALQVKNHNNGIIIENNADALVSVLEDYDSLKSQVNAYRGNGHACYCELIDDECYLEKLIDEKTTVNRDYENRLILYKRLMARIGEILYRVRHKVF